ncbi:hypothetical protein C2E21_5510 [Chlorella sorokiniana]|jgi:hypothetical protein|uniref:Uncharacterized protein n=1 Tax=Chlorella sorokiniana TaxID=3076 RepID=A0A2P6TP20_CHLSO|nr:hypothetical protein C2E21_5510 [Chlorella sorokiniana]|eukprot:PRW51080.1 hypothetical protein C2E21_5510 [Chlorella sorokiniana]
MSKTGLCFALVWLMTLGGGITILGGLGALTNDSEVSPLFPPYRLAWVGWSLEVCALLVTLFALAVGPFRNWRATVLFFYATCTAFLIPITNDVFVNKGALPGSNGSDARANATGAGLIIIFIGNYLQAILAAFHDVEPKPEQMQANSPKDMA